MSSILQAVNAPARPFRFGVNVRKARGREEIEQVAARAEALGYSAVFTSDHLIRQPLGPVATMAALAMVTTSVRLGCLVFANDFRNPVHLAKEMATIDVISGGRVELGLGAGWLKDDYELAGVAMDRPSIRIERLRRGVEAVECAFATGDPRPVQQPGPPLIIGGGGPKVLTLAAEKADIVAVNPSVPSGSFDARMGAQATRGASRDRIDVLRAAAGPRYSSLTIMSPVRHAAVTVPSHQYEIARALGEPVGLSPADVPSAETFLVGTVEEIVEELEERRAELDFSYYVWDADVMDDFAAVVERLSGR